MKQLSHKNFKFIDIGKLEVDSTLLNVFTQSDLDNWNNFLRVVKEQLQLHKKQCREMEDKIRLSGFRDKKSRTSNNSPNSSFHAA